MQRMVKLFCQGDLPAAIVHFIILVVLVEIISWPGQFASCFTLYHFRLQLLRITGFSLSSSSQVAASDLRNQFRASSWILQCSRRSELKTELEVLRSVTLYPANGSLISPLGLRDFSPHKPRRKKAPNMDEKLDRVILALSVFKRVYGHLRVPYWFIVPKEKDGDVVTNSRIRRKLPSNPGDSVLRPQDKLPVVKTSLDSPYVFPEEVQGLRLGLRVARIRKGQLYTSPEARKRLAEVGLTFDYFDEQRPPDCKRTSPTTYAGIHSDLTANTGRDLRSQNLHQPTNSSISISSSSSSLVTISTASSENDYFARQPIDKLRSTIQSSDNDNNNDDDDDDSTIKNAWSSREFSRYEKFRIILAALKVHDDLFGDLLVPRYFVVPSEEPWPRETWGLQLGNRVRNIRAKRAYDTPYFRRKLDEIGFTFDLTDYKLQFGPENDDYL